MFRRRKSQYIIAGRLSSGALMFRHTPHLRQAIHWFDGVSVGQIMLDGTIVRSRGEMTSELADQLVRLHQSQPKPKR